MIANIDVFHTKPQYARGATALHVSLGVKSYRRSITARTANNFEVLPNAWRALMSYTRQEVMRIRDGSAAAWVLGEATWREVQGTLRAELEVNVDGMEPGAVRLHLNIRSNRPTFVLSIRGQHCHRLDVNQPHHDCPGTHVQWRDDPNDDEQTRCAEDEFPPIPASGTVDGELYAATFRAFARYLNIDLAMFEWTDPPERGQADVSD